MLDDNRRTLLRPRERRCIDRGSFKQSEPMASSSPRVAQSGKRAFPAMEPRQAAVSFRQEETPGFKYYEHLGIWLDYDSDDGLSGWEHL